MPQVPVLRAEEGAGCPGVGAVDSCELLIVGAGDRTWVHCYPVIYSS